MDSMVDPVLAEIRVLVVEACQHPRGQLRRNLALTRLIIAIERSRKLWHEPTPYYEDALQMTWVYLSRNLCEADTGKQYDADKSNVITWLNAYLRRRLQDFQQQTWTEQQQRRFSFPDGQTVMQWLEGVPAHPEIPPILVETRTWAIADPTGELQNLHPRKRPDITAQVIILARLPPEQSWQDLATQYDCGVSTLSSFYQRKCQPLLRQFARQQGYIE